MKVVKSVKVVVICDDSKRELLLQFCTAYKPILKKCTLFSTAFISKVLLSHANLKTRSFLDAAQGGIQQISAHVTCGDFDLVVYFRDSTERASYESAAYELFRLCDLHLIPYATNLATAEVLVQGIPREDFAWRDLVKMG